METRNHPFHHLSGIGIILRRVIQGDPRVVEPLYLVALGINQGLLLIHGAWGLRAEKLIPKKVMIFGLIVPY